MGKTLEATKGMYYTNGIDTHGETIYLGKALKEEDFYEITEEEYRRLTAGENNADQGENSIG